MSAVFDTAALRQASEMVLPADPVEAARLWRHTADDLVAAAAYIEELEARLVECGGVVS